jgi:hypothetical protein
MLFLVVGTGYSGKALGLGVGAGFLGGALIGTAASVATLGVYHRYRTTLLPTPSMQLCVETVYLPYYWDLDGGDLGGRREEMSL